MTRRHWLLLAVMAVSIGVTVTASLGRLAGRTQAPAGWSRQSRGQVFVSAAAMGTTPPPWSHWSLSSYETLHTDASASQIEVRAEIPESGRLFVALAYNPTGESTGVLLESGSAPTGQRARANGSRIDKACIGETAPLDPGDVTVSLTRTDSGWSARIGEDTLTCSSAVAAGGPAVTAGLKRVVVTEFSVDQQSLPGPAPAAWLAGLLTALGIIALGRLEQRLHIGAVASLVSWSPLLLGPLGLCVDGAWVAETLRLARAPGDVLIVGGILAVTLGAKIMLILFILARDWTGRTALATAVCLVLPGAVGLGITAALGVTQSTGLLYGALAGLCAGSLIWVQARSGRVPLYNIVSLLLALATLGSIEVAVRFSSLGPVWNAVDTQRGAGSMQTLIQQFEDLERGVHTRYPSSGFPVSVGHKYDPVRVACLGASSTGGAYQNDNLNEFYPARLAERLGSDVDVINQGVGGWTSFHLRHFVDQHLESLEADVITIYLGVNENLPTPIPFSTLHDQWRAGNLENHTSRLDSVRLFQGLRLLARGLRPGGGAGVSADSLNQNLEHIVTVASEQGIRTLLMNEGLRPDPAVLSDYWSAMESVTDGRDDVVFLDTADVLHRVGTHAFLDANHLSDRGHRAVATAMADKLEALGWLRSSTP